MRQGDQITMNQHKKKKKNASFLPIFFFFHTVNVTAILAFCIYHPDRMEEGAQAPIGGVFERLFVKEVVVFLVFIGFGDACLPLCTSLEISL